jgi:ABC-2 type transport system permease protein
VAVYERSWRRYTGPITSLRARFLVVTRYALADAFASRAFTAFYALCLLPTLFGLLLVYTRHNLPLLEQLGADLDAAAARLTLVFFATLFSWQAFPAFFIAFIVSPSLVSADLTNHALPLYLSRPINRRDYVVGKMAVLLLLLSPVTWIGGLLVFALQAYLEGGGWWLENWRIAMAFLVGHTVWIVVVSLLSVAISAWVRYKPVARGALFGVFIVLGAFGGIVNLVTRSHYGDLVNLPKAIASILGHLFGESGHEGLPLTWNWLTLAAACLISLWLLHRKLRAHEVVR